MTIDIEHLRRWTGRTEVATDLAGPEPLARLAALLDHDRPPWPDAQVVPLGHWLNFLPRARQSELGPDGHPRRGGFLPPVPLPRRMWAGGSLTFHTPIPLGAELERHSTIEAVAAKTGRSGSMVFLTLHHQVRVGGKTAVEEQQDIVYREMPARDNTSVTTTAPPAPETKLPLPTWATSRSVDEVQLFRFSALTFNAHRIHYDRDYCRDVEGYPGLVVHGPFIAMLLVDHFLRRSPGARIRKFSFRARAPLFANEPFQLCMAEEHGGTNLWTLDRNGSMSMTATLESDGESRVSPL